MNPDLFRAEQCPRQPANDGRRAANITIGEGDCRIHTAAAEGRRYEIGARLVADESAVGCDQPLTRGETPPRGESFDLLPRSIARGDGEVNDVSLLGIDLRGR